VPLLVLPLYSPCVMLVQYTKSVKQFSSAVPHCYYVKDAGAARGGFLKMPVSTNPMLYAFHISLVFLGLRSIVHRYGIDGS